MIKEDTKMQELWLDAMPLFVRSQADFPSELGNSDLWRWLESPLSVDDLVSRLMALGSGDSDACRREILSFLDKATQKGVVFQLGSAQPMVPTLHWRAPSVLALGTQKSLTHQGTHTDTRPEDATYFHISA